MGFEKKRKSANYISYQMGFEKKSTKHKVKCNQPNITTITSHLKSLVNSDLSQFKYSKFVLM